MTPASTGSTKRHRFEAPRTPASSTHAKGAPTWILLYDYHAFHATRADLLRRLGRTRDARLAYDRAIALAANPAERAFLARRRDDLLP